MNVDRARFAQGMTYDDFKAQMTRNRERVEENERRVDISPNDLAAFRGLPKPIHTLVLAEDWCGDVIANLPVLARLAQESGKLDVRVFLRDQNDDIMQGYLNQGQYKSIPVFVFFDGDFREIGHWIERPASVTALRAKRRAEIFRAHPEFGGHPRDPRAGQPRRGVAAAHPRDRDGAQREDHVLRGVRVRAPDPRSRALAHAGVRPAARLDRAHSVGRGHVRRLRGRRARPLDVTGGRVPGARSRQACGPRATGLKAPLGMARGLILFVWTRSTRSAVPCTTCEFRSPTDATSAVSTACRRRSSAKTSSSCRAPRS